MNLPRTQVPTALMLQPLLAGVEPDIFFPFAGLLMLVVFTAQTNIWNLPIAAFVGGPVFAILRSQTAEDPFFFRVLKQGISAPRYLAASSSILAPPDKVLHR